ncbi:protein ECT2 isoform X2 [Rhinatrema bivittatum]|uniref:protein ECT2 isoform X2 n=1 Tax=Rhinatrema bivittatum TaxID=194408 RepID=UPI00112C15D9|nr:protein ECT2 isoform X2 [Rhinatrema bivittatum]
MTDNSMLTSATGMSLLADISVFDSKIAETSKENIFIGSASDIDEEMPQIETRVVLVKEAGKNEALLKALEDIKVPCIKTESVEELGDADCPEFETVFVVSDFENETYKYLHKTDHRVLGPPIVLYCAQKGEPLPFTCRPLYCASMLNLVLCFTGFRKKEELVGLVNLVHHMGGTIKRDFSSKVTHLIANSTHGDKFRVAVSLGTPIMKADWILKAWEKRDELDFFAADDEFKNEFKVAPFQDCILSFFGFSDEERASMEEMTQMQGGKYLAVGDDRCTHLVVEESTVKEFPFEPPAKLYVVKQEWFWGSIQMDARAGETMYLFEKPDSPALKKSVSLLSLNTPNSNRKKRRLRETLAQLTRETDISPFPPRKRPSAEHSLSVGSLLDISNTPESGKSYADYSGNRVAVRKSFSGRAQPTSHQSNRCSETRRKTKRRKCRSMKESNHHLDNCLPPKRLHPVGFLQPVHTTASKTPKTGAKPSKFSSHLPLKQSARWQVAMELYQTESNYVDILTTVVQLFQVPLEKEGQLGGPILAPEEIKAIFGSIQDILDVHTKIKGDLENLMRDWADSKSIGNVILTYSKDLVKIYPPFVNFFEMSKETIINCEKQKPRFHAFLKINQAKLECGRQTLAELLIRPVQRLPSVALLLNDIKKHTADDNPDKVTLEKAIESLKEVMMHINEDKRKTEAQRQIFDVVYEVDGCPANLLSSHRSLIQRVETIALGDDLCDRGEQVTLFLFNDCLEVARKRHKVISAFKSPHGPTRPPASLKHISLMPLSQIKKVLDIRETEDCHNAFALVVRPPTEQTNQLFSFQLTTEEIPKVDWLKMLCRHVANTICKADAENLIYTTDPESIEVNTKDIDSTLSRASRAIKKTSKKVTRAFSFSKTPKRALQRALLVHSTPEGRSPSSSSENLLCSRVTSTSSLAITRSNSTFSISGPARHASVQRSNSLDGSSSSPRSRPTLCPGSPSTPSLHPFKGMHILSSPKKLTPNSQLLSRPPAISVTAASEHMGEIEQGTDSPASKEKETCS